MEGDWDKKQPKDIAQALYDASNDDKRKLQSHNFKKTDSVWGKAYTLLFPKKYPNEDACRTLFQIWRDNRKKVEVRINNSMPTISDRNITKSFYLQEEFDSLSQKKRSLRKPHPVHANQNDSGLLPCVCERIKSNLPGDSRVVCKQIMFKENYDYTGNEY